jgi:predicted ATPase
MKEAIQQDDKLTELSRSREKLLKTNWYVITGGPSTGKTTTVDMLNQRGYKTTIEHARHYLDTQLVNGKTIEEIRENQVAFQAAILTMQLEQEKKLDPNEIVFLDRAIPDALAYYRFLKLPVDERLMKAIETCAYKKVFILHRLPFVDDYARTEDEESQKTLHHLIDDVYKSLPFPVKHVPPLGPELRVDYILANL